MPVPMKLLTKELLRQFPPHKATETVPMGERKVIAKYFHVFSSWTWYAIEYDAEAREFFGVVKGQETELGYFSLTEMEQLKTGGIGMERDLYFGQPKVKDIPELKDWLDNYRCGVRY